MGIEFSVAVLVADEQGAVEASALCCLHFDICGQAACREDISAIISFRHTDAVHGSDGQVIGFGAALVDDIQAHGEGFVRLRCAVDHRCIRHHIHGLLDGDHDILTHGSGSHGGICIVIGHRNGGGTYGSCRRYGHPEGSLSGLARLQDT